MCGIAGFFGLDRSPDTYASDLRRLLAAIAHRGPDQGGVYFDEVAGLTTARLAVLDPEGGRQPMRSADGRYVLSFNGEIFNHHDLRDELSALGAVFATRSDTEVLLQALIAWGENAAKRLNGQFAFAFYDRVERRLILGRDPFGERPLFFACTGPGVIFASEIKAIFALPGMRRTLDPHALKRQFHFWTAWGKTGFVGVESLPAGSVAVLRVGETPSIRKYYRFPLGQEKIRQSLPEARDQLRTLLEDSTAIRLQSDVGFSTYLSGGVDSTIVTAMTRDAAGGSVGAFSVAFEDGTFDESEYQSLAAERLGVPLTSERVGIENLRESIADVIWHAEAPQFRTAPIPMFRLARRVKEAGVKVVLTGEGSDEAFLGYNIFKETRFRRRFDGYKSEEERLADLTALYPYLAHYSSDRSKALVQFYASTTQEKISPLFSHEPRFTLGQFATRLLEGDYDPVEDSECLAVWLEEQCPGVGRGTDLEKAQVLEYLTLLEGYLLSSQGDRMLAAWGVEGRTPFLDPRVVELAFRLPEDYRLKNGEEKHILRESARDLIPQKLADRAKIPYRAPGATALLQQSRDDLLTEVVSKQGLADSDVVNGDFAGRFLERMRRANPDSVGPREEHALNLLISTLILERLFVRDFQVPPEPSDWEFRITDGR